MKAKRPTPATSAALPDSLDSPSPSLSRLRARARTGRPSLYSEGKGEKICAVLAQGYSLARAAAAVGVSTDSVYRWAKARPEFAAALDEARKRQREILYDRYMDWLDELAECHDVDRARVLDRACNQAWHVISATQADFSEKRTVEVNGNAAAVTSGFDWSKVSSENLRAAFEEWKRVEEERAQQA